MKLTAVERVSALQCLPSEGNIVTLRVVREAQNILSFKDEELKLLNPITVEGITKFDPVEAMKQVDIQLSDSAKSLISENLRKLEKEGKLTFQHMGTYEKFVEGKEV